MRVKRAYVILGFFYQLLFWGRGDILAQYATEPLQKIFFHYLRGQGTTLVKNCLGLSAHQKLQKYIL